MARDLATLAPGDAPGRAIRLVFFDVDGTLLNRDGELMPATLCAIDRLHQRNIITAFATGRPDFAVAELQARLRLSGPSVYYTGARCVWQGEILADFSLAESEWRPLAELAQRQGLHLEAYFDDGYWAICEDDIVREHARHLGVAPRLAPLSQWPARPAIKLLLGADLSLRPEGLEAIEQSVPGLQFAYAHLPSRPHWQFASVVHGQVNKTQLFHQLLSRLSLEPAQVVAFGDGDSDRAFLQAAGHGVAMGNAAAAVKACARWVTRPSWSDGVAYGLEKLLP